MKHFFCYVLLLFPSLLFAQRAVPAHGGIWVHDEAGLLSDGARAELESIVKAERDSTSNQIAVLIVPSLEGEDIDGYSIRVTDEWKLGKKDTDNGVLLLIAVQDRKVRIEVGLGLEGVLTDALSSRIIRNEIAPHFRQGDNDGGVKAGVLSIIQAIKGQYVNNDGPRRKGSRSPWSTLIFVIIMIIFMSRRNKGGRGGVGGGMGGFLVGSMLGSAMGRSSGSWDSGGSDFGGGGGFGGGGSSDSW